MSWNWIAGANNLNMPLVFAPARLPCEPEFSARMVIAADTLGWDAITTRHALLRAFCGSEERDILDTKTRIEVAVVRA